MADQAASSINTDIRYQVVSDLLEFHRDGETLKFICSTKPFLYKAFWSHETIFHKLTETEGEEGRMTFHIRFWDADIFRVQFSPGSILADPADLSSMPAEMLNGKPAGNIEVHIVEEDDRILAATSKIRLEITRNPFRITGRDMEGRVFIRQKGYEPVDSFASDSFQTSAAYVNSVCNCFEGIELRWDEAIYGLGERFDYVERRGKVTDFWNKDACGTSNRRSYINIPFFWSTMGYGVFLNNYGRIQWDIGTSEAGTINFKAEDDYIDYFVIYGPEPKQILYNYCRLTGFSPVPPVWTFGLWMSRNNYMTWDIVHEVAEELRKRGIPADVMHLDAAWFREPFNCDLRFSEERFAEPEKQMKRLKENGLRVSLWQWNFVSNREDNINFVEGQSKGYFAKAGDGEIFKYPEYAKGIWVEDAIIDFSNPEAAAWYAEQIKGLIKMGAAAIKTDFGEGIPADAIYKNIDGKRFHNYYSLVYNHVINKAIKEVSEETTVWARSGTAGSQRYPIHWGGDSQCSWNGLAGALKGILSAGLSGISFFSHDIGGFIGRPTPELYIRWAQMGLFSSHSRCHGMGDKNPREPWSFGEEISEIFKKFDCLRYRLLPYIYAQAFMCSKTGLPLLRALVLEYPEDRNVRFIEDQYMFGSELLIAPILAPAEEQPARRVYLPEGRWVDFWTLETFKSTGSWITHEVKPEVIPIYVKSSAILPYGPVRQSTDNRVGPVIGLEVYPSASGRWSYDDGENQLDARIEENTLNIMSSNKEGPLKVYFVGEPPLAINSAAFVEVEKARALIL